MSREGKEVSLEERREKILEYLGIRGQVTVISLSQYLNVSEVTIRKHLDQLAEQGLVTRVHGGAILSSRGQLEALFKEREKIHLEEKQRIALEASKYVVSGQAIFLDASTTALQVALLIKDRKDLTVVTNGLRTALELNFSPEITIYVIGRKLRLQSNSLVGMFNDDPLQNPLRRLHIDVGFFGAFGVTARDGLMEGDIDEARLKQHMVNASKKVIGIVDSSKFGVTALHKFALPEEIHVLITDDKAPVTEVSELGTPDRRVELV